MSKDLAKQFSRVESKLDEILDRLTILESNSGESNTSNGKKSYSSDSEYQPKEKFPQDYSDGTVVLVLNYGAKSHALFGDFKKTHSKFKDYMNKNKDVYSFNQGLLFGAGWVIKKKDSLKDVKKALKKHDIDFDVFEKDDYLEKVKNEEDEDDDTKKKGDESSDNESGGESDGESDNDSDDENKKDKKGDSDSESDEDDTKKDSKKKKSNKSDDSDESDGESDKEDDSKKKKDKGKKGKKESNKSDDDSDEEDAKSKKKKATKNKQGNLVDENGVVYMKVPLKNKKMTVVAVGIQGKKGKGVDSILPMDESVAKSLGKKTKILTKKMVDMIHKYDEKLADQLGNIFKEDESSDEEVDLGDSSDNGSDSD